MALAHPFDQDLLWADCQSFGLPFHFGGATERGRILDHTNNQDSLALWSRDNCVVGVVCDGCSSSARGTSNNEVGARLLSMAFASIVGEACAQSGVAGLQASLATLERQLCEKILQITSTLLPERYRDDLLHGLFMTTIQGFVVDASNYALFGCGDGFYAVNGKPSSLEELSGRYLAGRLLVRDEWSERLDKDDGALRLYEVGETAKLENIMVATDGFEELLRRFPPLIREFASASDVGHFGYGYAPGMAADFRRRVWNVDEVRLWAETQDSYDDRTFLLLRRDKASQEAQPELKKESSECSESPPPPSPDVAAS